MRVLPQLRRTARRAAVEPRSRSLRGQLVLIPTAMLILGFTGMIGVVLLNAHSRIAAEITSGVQLGHDLAVSALGDLADVRTPAAAFDQLRQDLPQVRHVWFELLPAPGVQAGEPAPQSRQPVQQRRSWLAWLLAPPPVQQTFPIMLHGIRIGELRLHSDSAAEIAEILGEVRLFAGVLIASDLLIVFGLLWTVRRSLRPLLLLADGFNRLERGDYRPIAPIPVRELARIGRQFNRLAESLLRVTSDNHFLIDKLLSLQEQERKDVAAELHDEFGPVLFAIRAEAAGILQALPPDNELHARAASISALADGIQKVNYRMLDRLRPLVLEQMGLAQALRQQLATWRTTYPDVTWSLDLPQDFADPDESLSLTLYRAVQEGATNAVRHARASAIDMRLRRQTSAAGCSVQLSIRDNGRGLPESFRCGFGLLGMTERVRQLGGTLAIDNARPGVAITLVVPEKDAVACVSC